MDYQSLIQLMTSKTLVKKVTPFLVSVSVFSFMFTNSSCHAFLFRFFKFYFSSLPMQVLSHALDKTWIFLICNGILVVIANTSSMVHSPSGSDLNDLLQKKIGDALPTPLDAKDNSLVVLEPDNAVPELGGEENENDETEEDEKDECFTEEKQQENSCLILDDEEEQNQESEFFITESGEAQLELQTSSIDMEDKENDEESQSWFMMEEEDNEQFIYVDEEEEEKRKFDKLSTEEINKKFDDFIRKMKEDLRIQALQQQQHLVLVK